MDIETVKQLSEGLLEACELSIYNASIGVSHEKIFVYIYEDCKHMRKKVPESWNGIPVTVQIIGRIVIKPLGQ